MKKRFLIAAGFAAAVGFGMTGCQSQQWELRNPFERHPKPEIKSPAEMDDIELKAPPERYTKDDYIRKMEKEAESGSSLAQTGSYGEKSGSEDLHSIDSERNIEKEKVASAAASGSHSYDHSEPAPGFSDYDVPSDLGGTAPFAPGSTGSRR